MPSAEARAGGSGNGGTTVPPFPEPPARRRATRAAERRNSCSAVPRATRARRCPRQSFLHRPCPWFPTRTHGAPPRRGATHAAASRAVTDPPAAGRWHADDRPRQTSERSTFYLDFRTHSRKANTLEGLGRVVARRWQRRCAVLLKPWAHRSPFSQEILVRRLVAAQDLVQYSRSLENPALQQLQKSPKSASTTPQLQKSPESASTTPQRPIWNSFATVGVRDFWENGCTYVA